jgi:hypothetical protein
VQQAIVVRARTAGNFSRGLAGLAALLVAVSFLVPLPASATDTLRWQTNQARVSADIKTWELTKLLEQVASVTGWKVFLEPGTAHTVSAKFKDLPPGDALHLLLGDLNFALVPQTNTNSRLFVFRTTMKSATQLIQPAKLAEAHAKPITNELIVRLKPGAKIDELARSLGAKVVGRIDGINAYRLQFSDEAATETARDQLSSSSDVASVENNFSIDRPMEPRQLQSSSLPPPSLQLKPPPDTGRIIVGLVDTAVQPLGNDLDKFLLKPVSVAGEAQLDPNSPSHGTAMAETILRSLEAMTKGNTSVQILPVDVYGPNATTSTFDVANGIVSAVNGGARVINLSLGSDGDSPILRDLIKDVSSKNVDLFAAKGNQPVTTAFFPAAYEGVTAVTALDQGQIAPYANRADIPAVGAPGTSVIYYNNQPYYVTGTSVSSAYVSGMAGGYMDATHKGVADARTYIQNTMAVKSGSGK